MKFCLPQALAISKHIFNVISPKQNLTPKYYIKDLYKQQTAAI